MGIFFRIPQLVLLGPAFLPTSAFAQATVRPLPSVAFTWEGGAVPAAANRKEAPIAMEADLDFLEPLDQEQQRPAGGSFAKLEFTLDETRNSAMEAGAGEVQTQRGGWKATLGEWVPDSTSFALEIGTEASFYDFGGGRSRRSIAGVVDPFNDVYDTRLGGRFVTRRDRKLSFYGGLEIGAAGEDATSPQDSIYYGGALALRYDASSKFALLVGLAGVSRFDDSFWILPYLGFDWRVTENLRFKTEAAEIQIDYDLNNRWSVGLDAGYDFRQYRLNPVGPLNAGSFRDEEVRAGAAIQWQMTEDIRLDLQAGKTLWREVRFTDGNRGYLGETELGMASYATLGFSVSF